MENNIQVQKAADISSLAGVAIVSLSALTAYNIGEKFNHNILFDATIFIISLVMLILTFAIFRKVMAGLFTTTSSSTTNKQVQSECSQESSHQNANQDSLEEEQIPDSLERSVSLFTTYTCRARAIFPKSFRIASNALHTKVRTTVLSLPPLNPIIQGILLSFSRYCSLISSII